ncbi:MAG: RsmE family RNA methyltransferase [Spirochaetes bacterium]|nr:RsmE family RNA methyltransferase [Spirochaetota bacterium]
MAQAAFNLREAQRDHSLILLNPGEFAALGEQGTLPLPLRHREHFGRVLRRNAAWQSLVSDGSGALAEATVAGETVELRSALPPLLQSATRVGLIQAWVKQKSLALILQKAAEIGVAEIRLVDSEYSQPHSEKAARIDAILENACMQAYNPFKPKVVQAQSLREMALSPETAFFGDLESGISLASVRRPSDTSAWFINGPEGGFSPAETAFLRGCATGVLLSENVLRSESAAIIALGFLRLPA